MKQFRVGDFSVVINRKDEDGYGFKVCKIPAGLGLNGPTLYSGETETEKECEELARKWIDENS